VRLWKKGGYKKGEHKKEQPMGGKKIRTFSGKQQRHGKQLK